MPRINRVHLDWAVAETRMTASVFGTQIILACPTDEGHDVRLSPVYVARAGNEELGTVERTFRHFEVGGTTPVYLARPARVPYMVYEASSLREAIDVLKKVKAEGGENPFPKYEPSPPSQKEVRDADNG